jgi:chemotaxis protein methyltransferase CheR
MDNEGILQKQSLSEKDFRRLSHFIESELGIKMPISKKIMLESRLQKRLKALKMETFDAYCEYVFSSEGQVNELFQMINIVTTNKTDFFRESSHFDYLVSHIMPCFSSGQISIWSAGCSTGEEPYTIAMVLEKYREKNKQVDFRILATDISTNVLDTARKAIYSADRVEGVPLEYKKKFMLKSKEPAAAQIRMKPEIRSKVGFARFNLMDPEFPIHQNFDIIFCRNVLIYFDKQRQRFLLEHFYEHIVSGGFLFLGHSETLTGLNIGFNQLVPTVYQKP